MKEMSKKNPQELTSYMESKPDSIFVWFTNRGNKVSKWSIDAIIRNILSLKYKKHGFAFSNSFSHVGISWVEGESIIAYHQTFPKMRRETYKPNKFNVIFEVTDPEVVKYARMFMQKEWSRGRGYGVLQVLMMGPQLLFGIKNPYTDGKVCSESVSEALGGLIQVNPDKTDPVGLFLAIKALKKPPRLIIGDFRES